MKLWIENIGNNPRAEVEDFFKTMDRDFDQKLTFAEFMGEESHIEKLFKSMDKNNDGFVTEKVVQAKFDFWVKMYFMFLRRTGSLSQRTLSIIDPIVEFVSPWNEFQTEIQ